LNLKNAWLRSTGAERPLILRGRSGFLVGVNNLTKCDLIDTDARESLSLRRKCEKACKHWSFRSMAMR